MARYMYISIHKSLNKIYRFESSKGLFPIMSLNPLKYTSQTPLINQNPSANPKLTPRPITPNLNYKHLAIAPRPPRVRSRASVFFEREEDRAPSLPPPPPRVSHSHTRLVRGVAGEERA